MSALAFARTRSSKTHSAIVKAENLPDSPTGKGKEVPFPYVDRSVYKSRHSNREINHAIEDAPIEDVKVSDLHAIQHSVKKPRLAEYIRHPDAVPIGTRGPRAGVPTDHPIVIRQDGKMMIHDGHHRCTAAFITGEKTIKARVVDFDKKGNDHAGTESTDSEPE